MWASGMFITGFNTVSGLGNDSRVVAVVHINSST